MKRKLALFACALICALLIAFNPDAMAAAREGYALWRDSVLPALLPFFVCTSLMRQMGALQSGNTAALFALAFISGAPGGARLSQQYMTDGEADGQQNKKKKIKENRKNKDCALSGGEDDKPWDQVSKGYVF